jgi:hypothetical protein
MGRKWKKIPNKSPIDAVARKVFFGAKNITYTFGDWIQDTFKG